MKILLTGATGLVGAELGLRLAQQGHQVLIVTRDREKALLHLPFPCEIIEGDLSRQPLDRNLTRGVEAVFHLMGENLSDSRWSETQKSRIRNSRLQGTRNLVNSFSQAPRVFISASAIGFYGDRGDEVLTESSSEGRGFLSELCRDWEVEADRISEVPPSSLDDSKVRVVKARLGVVLSPQGGALVKMKPAFQAGVGGPLGQGRQWMSWIHIEDAVNLFLFALNNNQVEGVINFVAPDPQTNRDFSKELATSLGRWLGPPVPSFGLRLLFGEMASVLLASQRVIPDQATKLGFRFLYPTLARAFEELLSPQKKGEEIFLAKQFLPYPREQVFKFFSEARNLEKMTPDNLHFHIVDISPPQIQLGTVINYRLRINGVPARWRTLIEKWNPPIEFVDTALKGPYRLWHHTHHFEELGSGTLMIDQVRYVLPLGIFGWLVAHWKVRSDVEKIFAFRRSVVGTFLAQAQKWGGG